MSTKDHILDYFEQWLRWHRTRRAWYWAHVGLVLGLVASFLLGSLGIGREWLLSREFFYLIGALSGLGLALGASSAYVWPIQRSTMAHFFDRHFGLEERLSTALELIASELDSNQDDSQYFHELSERQLDDTLQAAKTIDPQKYLPLRLNKLLSTFSLALILGLALIWVNGDSQFQAARAHRDTRAAIAEEIANLEDLQQGISTAENLKPEDREKLGEILQTAIEELETSGSLESALSILNQAEQNLAELNEPSVDQTIQSLRGIGEQFETGSGPISEMFEELEVGDLSALAEEMDSLSTDKLNSEEREAFAQNLDQVAQALENSNRNLADDLLSAAEALRAGDPAAADEALQEAAQTLSELSQAQNLNQTAQEAADQVAAGAQTMLSQVQSGSDSQAGVPGGAQGDSSSVQGGGVNTSGSQASQSSGSSAGRGEEDQTEGGGQAAGTDPISQGNAPGDGGEEDFEQLFSPQRLGGEDDLLVSIPGSNESGGQVIGEGETAQGAVSPLSVPYYEIYPTYQQAYQKAISSGEIPLALRPLVREYFSSLEPE